MFFIKEKAEDKKAEDLIALDIRKASNLCDYFFICGASSTRQVRAIADGVMDALNEKGIKPWHVEGYNEGQWVILDYNSVVAHIFYKETRLFYNLERLWGDAPHVSFVPRARRVKSRTGARLRKSKNCQDAKKPHRRRNLPPHSRFGRRA